MIPHPNRILTRTVFQTFLNVWKTVFVQRLLWKINSISFHQPHKQITKLKLYDLVTVLLFGEFVTIIRKNHSIFIFKANYKPQFKNCKFFISNVCNLWLHNNFTNSLLYLRIIWNKLSEYLLTEYYELDTILNATIMNLINSVCNPVVDF